MFEKCCFSLWQNKCTFSPYAYKRHLLNLPALFSVLLDGAHHYWLLGLWAWMLGSLILIFGPCSVSLIGSLSACSTTANKSGLSMLMLDVFGFKNMHALIQRSLQSPIAQGTCDQETPCSFWWRHPCGHSFFPLYVWLIPLERLGKAFLGRGALQLCTWKRLLDWGDYLGLETWPCLEEDHLRIWEKVIKYFISVF